MGFLYFLEGIRMPFLNEIMLLITQFGEETAFLVTAMIVFWCVNKYWGYYVLSVGFIGTLCNQFLKLIFRVPRPWVLDSNFTILEEAREAASGYSFPSGHTQSAVGTFGAIGYLAKNRWIKTIVILIAIFVPFSRMYIGVHTPADVLVAAAMAIALIYILKPVVLGKENAGFKCLLGFMLVLALGFLSYVEFYHFPEDIDAHNLTSGIKNAYTLLGSLMGLIVVYIVDKKWLNFPTEAIWWAQALKVLGGLLVVLAVKSGLKEPLNMILGESLGRAFRYFLVVVVAGILWPMTFKWFQKLGKKVS